MADTFLDDFSEISDSSDDDFVVIVQLLSPEKFLILLIATMGLYGFWWMYKVWQFFKEKDRLDIEPWARSVFSIFFMYQLLERVKHQAKEYKYFDNYMSLPLTFLFFGSGILLFLPAFLSLFFIIGVMALVKPHEAFNHLAKNVEGVRAVSQDKYNSRQIALVLLGVVVWIVALIRGFISTMLLT